MVTWEELKELHGEDDTDPHMELWVSRAAMEIVLKAAIECAERLYNIKQIPPAIASVQNAVYEGGYEPLDVTPLKCMM